MFTLRGKLVAGVMPLQNETQPPVWSTYIAVDDADADADATVAHASEAGGQVAMGVIDVMDAGRMAYLVDRAGAMVGIWQAGSNSGAQLVDEPGTLGFNELNTRDPEAAQAFYAGVFGWEPEPVQSSGGNYVIVARALELGGAVTAPAFDLDDVGRIAMLTDANGTPFAVTAPVAADE